jgi:hypothetical protein
MERGLLTAHSLAGVRTREGGPLIKKQGPFFEIVLHRYFISTISLNFNPFSFVVVKNSVNIAK